MNGQEVRSGDDSSIVIIACKKERKGSGGVVYWDVLAFHWRIFRAMDLAMALAVISWE